MNSGTGRRMEHVSPPRCNVERAKYGKYDTFSERMKTYQDWPKKEVIDPSDLAGAGLFFTGTGDLVRCFNCGGGLMDWEVGDVPSTEHANLFPCCAFLKPRNAQDVNSEMGKNEKADIYKRNLSSHQSRISVEEAGSRATYVEPDTRAPGQPDLPQPNLIDKHSTDILSAETVYFANASPEELEDQRSLNRLREENKRLKDTLTCKTCWKCEACILFLPCADLVACEFCSQRLEDCPVCGTNIFERVKIFR